MRRITAQRAADFPGLVLVQPHSGRTRGYLAQAFGSSHTDPTMLVRAPRVLLLSLLAAVCVVAAAPSGARARDVRELLTPRGWEDARSAARPADMSLDDDELIEPSGWRSKQACTMELGSGGELCSELLVPADWSALLGKRAARPHA